MVYFSNEFLFLFVECAPTFTCLKKVETEKLGIDLDEGPWEKVANQEYICG